MPSEPSPSVCGELRCMRRRLLPCGNAARSPSQCFRPKSPSGLLPRLSLLLCTLPAPPYEPPCDRTSRRVDKCSSELSRHVTRPVDGSARLLAARPPSHLCQRVGSLASSASPAPRFRGSHSALVLTGGPFRASAPARWPSLVSTHLTSILTLRPPVFNQPDATSRQLTRSLARSLVSAHIASALPCVRRSSTSRTPLLASPTGRWRTHHQAP